MKSPFQYPVAFTNFSQNGVNKYVPLYPEFWVKAGQLELRPVEDTQWINLQAQVVESCDVLIMSHPMIYTNPQSRPNYILVHPNLELTWYQAEIIVSQQLMDKIQGLRRGASDFELLSVPLLNDSFQGMKFDDAVQMVRDYNSSAFRRNRRRLATIGV